MIAVTSSIIVGFTFTATGIIFGFTVGELNPCKSPVDRIRDRGAFYAGMYFTVAAVVLIANFVTWWTFGIIAEKMLQPSRSVSGLVVGANNSLALIGRADSQQVPCGNH